MVTADGTLLRRLAVMLQGNDGEVAKQPRDARQRRRLGSSCSRQDSSIGGLRDQEADLRLGDSVLVVMLACSQGGWTQRIGGATDAHFWIE